MTTGNTPQFKQFTWDELFRINWDNDPPRQFHVEQFPQGPGLHIRIFVNGEEAKNCFAYDMDLGYADCYLERSGKPFVGSFANVALRIDGNIVDAREVSYVSPVNLDEYHYIVDAPCWVRRRGKVEVSRKSGEAQ